MTCGPNVTPCFLLGVECVFCIRVFAPNIESPPQPCRRWDSQQCKSWNKGLESRDCLMFKPRQQSPPRSNRGPARKSRYHRSFIRCRKKSSCISHTSLYCGVQAPAFFRFRSSESKQSCFFARSYDSASPLTIPPCEPVISPFPSHRDKRPPESRAFGCQGKTWYKVKRRRDLYSD